MLETILMLIIYFLASVGAVYIALYAIILIRGGKKPPTVSYTQSDVSFGFSSEIEIGNGEEIGALIENESM